MDTKSIAQPAHPVPESTIVPRALRSTRHHRVDERFVDLLEEDFGNPRFALVNAFMGMPAESKTSAIALGEWASRTDNPARALLGWARKNGRGTFRPDDSDVAAEHGEAPSGDHGVL